MLRKLPVTLAAAAVAMAALSGCSTGGRSAQLPHHATVTDPAGDLLPPPGSKGTQPGTGDTDMTRFTYRAGDGKLTLAWTVTKLLVPAGMAAPGKGAKLPAPPAGATRGGPPVPVASTADQQVFTATATSHSKLVFSLRVTGPAVDIFDARGTAHPCRGAKAGFDPTANTVTVTAPLTCLPSAASVAVAPAVALYGPGPVQDPYKALDPGSPGRPIGLG